MAPRKLPTVSAVVREAIAERSEPRALSVPIADGPLLLKRLRRGLLRILLAFVVGAVLGGFAGGMTPISYRATATLLAQEPVMAGAGPTIDYNLTLIRSFKALLSSPALAMGCASDGGLRPVPAAASVRVRMPENTRLLELSAAAPDPARAAAFVTCIASRAAEENRRLNRERAEAAASLVEPPRDAARRDLEALQGRLAELRTSGSFERKRAELRASIAALEAAEQDERRARVALAEAVARTGSYAETAAGRPESRKFESFLKAVPEENALRKTTSNDGAAPVVREEGDPVRDLAERGRAEGTASRASALASIEAANAQRASAFRRIAALEAELAKGEQELNVVMKRIEGMAVAQTELERRYALVRIEAAARAFELTMLAPPVPPRNPEGPRAIGGAALGGIAAAALAAFFVLSRPEPASGLL